MASTSPVTSPSSQHGGESNQVVGDCILELQGLFGARIARVLVQKRGEDGRSRGLLVFLDRVGAEDDAAIEGLLDQVPVALIHRRTLARLGRLGSASPVAEAEPVFQTETAPTEPPAEHPLMRRAREALEAATLLAQQSCPGPAAELLLSALLAAAASRAGRESAPAPQQLGVWLYAEALPGGALTQDDAAVLMRAVALAQGGDALPQALLETLIEDAAAFVAMSARAEPSGLP